MGSSGIDERAILSVNSVCRGRQHVVDQQLQPVLAHELVDIKAIDQLRGAARQLRGGLLGRGEIEGDGVERAPRTWMLDPHLQVLVADEPRRADGEHAVEARFGKALAPWAAGSKRLRGFERDLVDSQ